jgi:toxin ParE1/3/4
MSRYEFAPRAVADLQEIVRYTKQTWGVAQAQRYREELELALQQLALAPGMGRARERIGPRLRSFRVVEHVAFYVQRRNSIRILRILHPSRDVDAVFEEDG